MLDPVSPRSGAFAALETRRQAPADVAATAPVRARSDVPAPASGKAQSAAPVAGGVARSLSQSAPVDAARVAELRNALKVGNYPVQPERLATAMMASLKA